MYELKQITNDYKQIHNFTLPDGSSLECTIRWSEMQIGWFFDSIAYPNFLLKGMRICNSPNLLNQWRNLIPFGIACISKNNREPSLQNDFASKASVLYVLTEEEVAEYAAYLSG